MTPLIQLRSDAVNVSAIRAYWIARAAARSWEEYARADITYLYDTDRIAAADIPGTIDKPLGVWPLICDSIAARRKDGDLTVWSDPPAWWKR